MKQRNWDTTTQPLIVPQRLKGKPVAAICGGHEIRPSPSMTNGETDLGPMQPKHSARWGPLPSIQHLKAEHPF